MCVDDVVPIGAEPLFFLDYVAIGKLRAEHVAQIVKGIAEGCRKSGCALVGGEMAEHPGVMLQPYFIREQRLTYPIGVSAAETLRATSDTGGKDGRFLFGGMGFSAIYALLRDGFGILPQYLGLTTVVPGVTLGVYDSPMLENPYILPQIVKESGAKSSDYSAPETADELCARTAPYAQEWAPKAKELWLDEHPTGKKVYDDQMTCEKIELKAQRIAQEDAENEAVHV